MELVIHGLLKRVDPYNVFYFSCDELVDHAGLGEVLDSYLRSAKARGLGVCYIFLNEVTFVSDWWRALKQRVDNVSLTQAVVTAAGSSSIEIAKRRETFLGRRG